MLRLGEFPALLTLTNYYLSFVLHTPSVLYGLLSADGEWTHFLIEKSEYAVERREATVVRTAGMRPRDRSATETVARLALGPTRRRSFNAGMVSQLTDKYIKHQCKVFLSTCVECPAQVDIAHNPTNLGPLL